MAAVQEDQNMGALGRKPLESQKYVGGDMSMMAFVQPAAAPNRFAYPDGHHVKGLNAETLAKIQLPRPQWLSAPEYAPILGDAEPLSPSIFFSLNISLYNQQINASEWANQWFLMTGRVHPYALTWELEQRDGLESDGENISQYTVPTFVVRDHGFQPVSPRRLGSSSAYPTIMPVVSFTGPVVGSGLELLQADAASAFDESQLKCCFHPFQVFVIFPVHANPWTSLCKKMAQRRDSQFQPGAPFTCTGKVAGLLAHKHMRNPPALEQDYIFIVVPDTWTFLDKASFNQSPAALFTPVTPKRSVSGASEYDDAMARFTTTKKRSGPAEGGAPVTPKSLPPAPAGIPTKRPLPALHDTPTKKPRPPPAPSTVFVARDGDEPCSQDSLDDGEDDDVGDDGEDDGNDASAAEPPDASSATDHGSPDISTIDMPRPLRNRQPPRKYPEAV
ncbi:hypothetical protein VFPFJ_11711 [Purpureocillium lilacinum]|uniref:Uncharacterized protein n=1 Tax=Purpureocillium lilacinum TaxID=33203 RepID=A0A179EY25_PURLI|nr:hypothetical protein VFPFJ_11711 [Purpureocillium lilacinum]OAQ57910.1 hypothetical protein VFPFJ_11711 [Purpureocillium lilacinum]